MEKKVAFISEGYIETKDKTGGSILNTEFLKRLVSLGYKVDVYSGRFENITNLMSNYYSLDELENVDLRSKYDYVLSDQAIYESDITYIHSHSYKYRIEKLQTKLTQLTYKLISSRHHKKRVMADIKIKENLDKIPQIVVSSFFLKKDYMQNLGVAEEKLVILPPPVINVKAPNFRAKGKTVIFGLAANGFVNKGGYITISALRKLKRKCKDFKVRIIYEKASKNLGLQFLLFIYGLKNHVEFLPTQYDMNEFYKSLDFMLVPSKIETFSMVAIEAMAHFKPVVVSSVCGVTDYVKDSVNGYCVDYEKGNKSANLAAKMLNAIQLSSEAYGTIAKAAAKTVEPLTLDNFVNGYLRLLEIE
ncbi:glycosyltransferase family 4 protein [bacterium]|nr:glycosyltransferase family 4 protein [bacterium]